MKRASKGHMIKLNFILLSSLTLLTACATVNPSFVRDGKQVYEAKCPGAARSIADCHQLAAKQCNGSYNEMSVEGTTTGMMNMGNGMYGAAIKRSLLFTCKEEIQAAHP